MSRKPRKDALLKIRLSEALKEEVERLATEKGETLSFVIREAVRRYIDETASGQSDTRAAVDQIMRVIGIEASSKTKRLADYAVKSGEPCKVAEDLDGSANGSS